jgi:hypothetical protein
MVGVSRITLREGFRSFRATFAGKPQNDLYDVMMLFGDSITEFSESQERGFAFAPQVRAGKPPPHPYPPLPPGPH